MSRNNVENSVQMNTIDVDVKVKGSDENLLQNNSECELEPQTEGTTSARSTTSSEQEISSLEDYDEIYQPITKCAENLDDIQPHVDHTSLSSEANLTEDSYSSDVASNMAVDHDIGISTKTSILLDELPGESCLLINNALPNIDHKEINSNDKLCNNLETTSQLATSTVSLHEGIATDKKMNHCISQHSKSAENIMCIVPNVPDSKESSMCDLDLNTEQILSQFTVQKTKASATQKITTEQQHDTKFARLPKEILSQDIGSIVKNVHGIFSSVSGSLKYAYSNSGRGSVQKLLNNVTPLPHHKTTTDGVKEQQQQTRQDHEDRPEEIHVNGIDQPSDSPDLNHIDHKINLSNIDQKEPNKDVLRIQIESLEQSLAEQRRENVTLRERVKQQTDELLKKDNIFKELENKMDKMVKRVESAEREKDLAVMRYAGAECGGIEARREAARAAAELAAAARDSRLLEGKLRAAQAERERLCQLYDDKNHELLTSEREVVKVREELRELEGRLKWTQSKLRAEMDAYKESSERAERLAQQLAQLEAARGAAVSAAEDAAKAKELEGELKECRAALILCRHERDELEGRLRSVSGELEESSRALVLSEASASGARARAGALEAECARARAQAAESERALAEERARATAGEAREARALQLAERLTADHVALSATAEDAQAKAAALEADNVSLREEARALRAEAESARAQYAVEAERRTRETKVLARKVAELTEELSEVREKLEWEKGENGVLKKKHASAIKEVNRELQRALRRCAQLEARPPPRPESVSSASSAETTAGEAPPDVQGAGDRQALIERIVSLQRLGARRADRCEFLEEHARQLTDELRRKGRLLRHLLTAQPAGALASPHTDVNKKEIARLGGGAMAALWGEADGGGELPAELLREVTQRLQAVLEDALLKNITLKENMDTLGEEIARLKQKNKDAQ